MPTSLRRVRKLRLAAPTDALVRRATNLLADALHTASLPESGGRRLLIIRSYPVGAVGPSENSSALALRIERGVQRLATAAVHGADPAAGSSPVVYFHDDLEPYVLLARRLVRQEACDAWFWSLAVPVWRPGLPTDEALRALLMGVMDREAGVCAATTLLRSINGGGDRDRFLGVLRWQEGAELLNASGWTRPELRSRRLNPISSRAQNQEVSGIWREVLERWGSRWGEDDARTVWLAGVLLVMDKPARLHDSRLTERIHSLIRRVVGHSTGGVSDEPTPWAPGADVGSEEVAGRSVPAGVSGVERMTTEALNGSLAGSPLERRDTVEGDRARSGHSGRSNGRFTRREDERSAELPTPSGSVERAIEATSPASPVRQARPSNEETSETFGPSDSRQGELVPAELASASATAAELKAGDEAVLLLSSGQRNAWSDAPRFTQFAGLFFLIQMMSRLGVSQWLRAHPGLIDMDIPDRLMRLVAGRLGAEKRDPVLTALAEGGSEAPMPDSGFVMPTSWQQGLYREGTWALRSMGSDAWVLMDNSGRQTVAWWSGSMPEEVRALVGDRTVSVGPMIRPEGALEILLRAWITGLRRWCRRNLRFGLGSLVRRGGRVAATRTHLDVIFSHRQVDVRVRKAGLDVDPGWVPWLGRVIQFHYVAEGALDVEPDDEAGTSER